MASKSSYWRTGESLLSLHSATFAGAGSAWGFWKTMRAISPKAIADEAALPFRLALVGDLDGRKRLRDALLTEKATLEERDEAEHYLKEFAAPPDPDQAKAYTFVLYASENNDNSRIGARGPNSVPLSGTISEVAAGLIAQRPDLAVAMARRFPRLRVGAASKIIADTSRVNAGFALMSALPGVVPLSAIFLPASSVADVIVLTKNQIMMVMRLAAIHGGKPAYTKQVKELIGTVGSALGWRTLARQLVGLVPAGIGVALKASIAYSGTFALGRSALWFYQTGKVPTPKEIKTLYKSSEPEAKKEVEAIRHETGK